MSWIEKFKEKKDQRREEKRKRREGEQTFDELVYEIKKVLEETPPKEEIEPEPEPQIEIKKKKKKKDE